ncbi:MAG: O-antigen ligase family protein [Candidatus Binatia bacterium]
MDLKYYGFIFGAALSLQLAAWAALSQRVFRGVFVAFLLSTLYMFDINFMSHEWYRGSTRGFEVSISDLLLVILLIAFFAQSKSLNRVEGGIQWFPKGTIPILLFLGIATLSLLGAESRLYGLFELSKMLKGLMIFWVVANLVKTEEWTRVAFYTIFVMAGLEIAFASIQHFRGIYRLPGTLGHPNSLAMYMNMLIPILLAYALVSEARRRWIFFILIAGGVTIVILTFSRGGWIGLASACGIVVCISLIQKPSPRLVGILALGVIMVGGLVVKEWPHMVNRWTDAPVESLNSRLKMNEGAYVMMEQTPWLGVGVNNSAAWLQQKEKDDGRDSFSRITGRSRLNLLLGELQLSKEELEQDIEALTYVEHGVMIHNIYLVTAAETGLLGLGAFLLIALRLGWIAVRTVLVSHQGLGGVLALGILGGFVATYVQGLAEWEIRQTPLFYLFWTLMGLLVAINRMPARQGEQKERRTFQLSSPISALPLATRGGPSVPLTKS